MRDWIIFAATAGMILVSGCKTTERAENKGVIGRPGALSSETTALILYEFGFDDPALPPTYAWSESERKDVAVTNAFCLYMVEVDADETITQEMGVELFRAARPVTVHAISRTGMNTETASFIEGLRSAFSLRSNPVWAGNDLMDDEIYGLRSPASQATVRETRTGLRTMRRYVEAAKNNEDPKGRACPQVHPRSTRTE